MFPDGFKQRIISQNYINSESLLRTLGEPAPVSIRINPSKWDKVPVNATKVPWCDTGFYLESRPSFTLDPLFHSGCYYPQEASSMFLEHAIRKTLLSTDNLRVLDLCGAPGGKSTHLSEIIGPGSLLVSNEVIRSRAVVLSENVTKWGNGNTLVTQSDPGAYGKLEGYFDLIIVDAPCSGEGMFRNNIAINEWSVENTRHCSERQKRILMDVWPALKEEGILIYSTCTFNPAENEENIKWLTDRHEAECLKVDVSGINGITEIDFEGIFGYGLYPDKIRGEGFFISVIRKRGRQKVKPVFSKSDNNLKPAKTDVEIADRWTDFSKERIIKWGDEVIAVPCSINDYLFLFSNLKIIKAGTKLFVQKKNSFLPSHELALSQHLKNSIFPVEEADLQDAISFLRRDNLTFINAQKGWNIITYRGNRIGLINNIGPRINNYYPLEWRIRMESSEAGSANIIKWNIDGRNVS